MTEEIARQTINEAYASFDYEEAWQKLSYLLSPHRIKPCTEDDIHASLTESVCVDWLLKEFDPMAYQLAISDIINNQ
jgi:hypothetical protein